MKEQTQQPGVRKWAGDDMVALQAEPLSAIQGFFEEYGNCIIQGCAVVPAAGGKFDIAPGLLGLSGTDAGGDDTFKVVPFSGVGNVTLPLYFTLTYSVLDRVYGDGKVKPIAYDYRAAVSAVKPAAVEFLELTTAGGRRFVDAVKITEKLDKVGNGKDVTVTFSQAASRVNIASGEKLTTILGKIVRWLADLKALAFKDKVSKTDLDTALQAEVNGKVKIDGTTVMNGVLCVNNAPGNTLNACFGKNYAGNSIHISLNDTDNTSKCYLRINTDNPYYYGGKEESVVWHAGNFNPATKEPVFTKNTAFNKNFGTAAGTVCQGNDARLSDARPANGGNADTSGALLITYNRPNYGNGLIMNQEVGLQDAPTPIDYFSYLRLLHPNSDGYFSELAMSFTGSTRMYYRNMIAGVAYPWNTVAYLTDIPTALPANGGNADTVGGIGATSLMRRYTITVGGDTSHFYPCTWVEDYTSVYMSIHSATLPGSSAHNQNEATFLISSNGYSDMPIRLMCLEHGMYQYSEVTVHSVYSGSANGMNCIYLRGGMSYTVFSNTALTPNNSSVTHGAEVFGVMSDDGTVSTTNAIRIWSYTEGISWLGKQGDQAIQGNLTLNTSNASCLLFNRAEQTKGYIGCGETEKTDIFIANYVGGNNIKISDDGKNYSNGKEIATVDQIPTDFSQLGDAASVTVEPNTAIRKTVVCAEKKGQGFKSRVALGLTNPGLLFSPAILSVGVNDAGTSFVDYVFGTNGRISSPTGTFALTSEIKTLSGGAAATAGQYVAGIAVNDHEITVTNAALPTREKSVAGGDWNTILEAGVYSRVPQIPATNTPDDSDVYGTLIVETQAYSITQIFYGSFKTMYFRTKIDGSNVFSAWTQVAKKSDIPTNTAQLTEAANKKFVTDAEKAKLSVSLNVMCAGVMRWDGSVLKKRGDFYTEILTPGYITITHNLGHTDYIVNAMLGNGEIISISEPTANSFVMRIGLLNIHTKFVMYII